MEMKDSGFLSSGITAVVAVCVLLVTAREAFAVDKSWNNPAGGNWSVAGNWTPAGAPGPSDNALITLDGSYTVTLDVDATIAGLTLGGASGTQTLSIPGNTLTLNGPGTVNANGVIGHSGGTLTGTGTLTVNGPYNWSGGTMSGTGTTNANGGMTISGASTKTLNTGRVVNNAGVATWTSPFNVDSGGGAVFNNLAGATFDFQSDTGIFHDLGGALPTFNNAGTLTKSAGTGTSTIGIAFNNSGTVNAQSGQLSIGSTGSFIARGTVAINGGTLTRTGTINVDVVNAGLISPGLSPGIINISGDYSQVSGGTLTMELNGTTAGSGYDQLHVVGTVTLAGTLNVTLGFTPTTGNTFTIIMNDGTDAVIGAFAGKPEGGTFTVGTRTLRITYAGGDGNDVVLTDATACSLNVTTTADGPAGSGSLRSAIICANVTPGADTITLPAGTYTLAIPGTGEDAAATGDLDITDSLTIDGAGETTTIVDANSLDHVFHIAGTGSVSVEMVGLTLRGGNVSLGPANGGGILVDSAGQSLTLRNVTLTANRAGSGGGGIYNTGGALTLDSVTVDGNAAVDGNGGGIDNYGSTSLANISNSRIDNNTASNGNGGGIDNGSVVGARMTLTDTTISENTARSGGGISNTSDLDIVRSTLSGNTAGSGGGLYSQLGQVIVVNSTISGNTTVADTGSGSGAGIYFNSGSLDLFNVTIAYNGIPGAISPAGGGLYEEGYDSSASNSIIAKNSPDDCAGYGTTDTPSNYNIDSDGTCHFPGTGNQTLDPLLGNLTDNGGPTQTHALLTGSPALDAGDPAGCEDAQGNLLTTDQRGVSRPQGSACDIGAYEAQVAPARTLTINRSGNGRITSNPPGIDCGTDCSESFPDGTKVYLTATPDTGYYFAGWSGDADCSDGIITADADRNCTATFNLIPTLGITIGPNSPPHGTAYTRGQTSRPMLQFVATAGSSEPVRMTGITLTASGTGNDVTGIIAVKVWLDANGNGSVDGGDTQIGSGTYSADNGTLTLTFTTPQVIPASQSRTYLITYDF
jgi:hypothetical protein